MNDNFSFALTCNNCKLLVKLRVNNEKLNYNSSFIKY